MKRERRAGAWVVALAIALAAHGAALFWLAPRLERGGPGPAGESAPGLRLSLAAVSAPSPALARRPDPLDAVAPTDTPPRPLEANTAPSASALAAPPETQKNTVHTATAQEPPVDTPIGAEATATDGEHSDTESSEIAQPADSADSADSAGSPGASGSAGGGEARARYVDQLSSRVQSCLRYPRRALRRRIEGDVDLVLRIAADGELQGTSVLRDAGSALLLRDAIDTVERCAPYPPPPADAGGPGEYDVRVGYELQ